MAIAILGAACDGTGSRRCDAEIDAWVDEDGDGFGAEPAGKVCELAAGQADRPLDCDDADPDRHPESAELCDGVDNDCDGLLDEDLGSELWHQDGDGDGFGVRYVTVFACARPADGWVTNAEDCDDEDPARNPDAQEVCGGVDEDCDGFDGDFDDSLDETSTETFYRDLDGDNYGNRAQPGHSCLLQRGYSVNSLDCNDQDPLVGQFEFYADSDQDGYGNRDVVQLACIAPPMTVRNDLDCDDTDPSVNIDRYWYRDTDGDGFGTSSPLGFQCAAPVPDAILVSDDCNDTDPDVHPGAPEACLDGVDANCDGGDACRTCAEVLLTDAASTSGVYGLQPNPVGAVLDVWCDMETDGGGWTMVASTHNVPLVDARGVYHNELATLTPSATHSQIWGGLRTVITGNSDIRFTCSTPASGTDMVVDLSFYDIHWYDELTTSQNEAAICFNENEGAGYDSPAPARKNNLTGDSLPLGDDWNAGFLEGEDLCGASTDFTIDFDDRGVRGDPDDGTDWGEANNNNKCGVSGVTANWFIFVREP